MQLLPDDYVSRYHKSDFPFFLGILGKTIVDDPTIDARASLHVDLNPSPVIRGSNRGAIINVSLNKVLVGRVGTRWTFHMGNLGNPRASRLDDSGNSWGIPRGISRSRRRHTVRCSESVPTRFLPVLSFLFDRATLHLPGLHSSALIRIRAALRNPKR